MPAVPLCLLRPLLCMLRCLLYTAQSPQRVCWFINVTPASTPTPSQTSAHLAPCLLPGSAVPGPEGAARAPPPPPYRHTAAGGRGLAYPELFLESHGMQRLDVHLRLGSVFGLPAQSRHAPTQHPPERFVLSTPPPPCLPYRTTCRSCLCCCTSWSPSALPPWVRALRVCVYIVCMRKMEFNAWGGPLRDLTRAVESCLANRRESACMPVLSFPPQRRLSGSLPTSATRSRWRACTACCAPTCCAA